MAIVLGRRESVQHLVQVVSQTFDSIRLIESVSELEKYQAMFTSHLTVVTDSFPGGVTPHLLVQVKEKLNPRALICLAENINVKTEIELRAIGLAFLGSYQAFFQRAAGMVRI